MIEYHEDDRPYDEDEEWIEDDEPDYDLIIDERRMNDLIDEPRWAFNKADTYEDTNIVMP